MQKKEITFNDLVNDLLKIQDDIEKATDLIEYGLSQAKLGYANGFIKIEHGLDILKEKRK